MNLILLVDVFISLHRCISTSCHPFIGVFIVPTDRVGENTHRGRTDTRLIQRGCAKVRDTRYLPSLSSWKYIERIKECMRSVKRRGTRSMPMTDDGKGS